MIPVRATAVVALLAFAGASPALAVSPSPAPPAGDPGHGQSLYEAKCGGCHSIDTNRIGPMHRGVVGRKAGIIAGFAYSPALKKSGLVWTAATLDRWLTGPTKLVPGTRMGFVLADPADRRDVIAYLATQTAPAR